jgi:F0F1-type ATP synthase membrane subunit a
VVQVQVSEVEELLQMERPMLWSVLVLVVVVVVVVKVAEHRRPVQPER